LIFMENQVDIAAIQQAWQIANILGHRRLW
jgi:hypothetical protein